MSKSVFYASKESLRQTREKELTELIQLRKFVKHVLSIPLNEATDIDTVMEIRGMAYGLKYLYELDWEEDAS